MNAGKEAQPKPKRQGAHIGKSPNASQSYEEEKEPALKSNSKISAQKNGNVQNRSVKKKMPLITMGMGFEQDEVQQKSAADPSKKHKPEIVLGNSQNNTVSNTNSTTFIQEENPVSSSPSQGSENEVNEYAEEQDAREDRRSSRTIENPHLIAYIQQMGPEENLLALICRLQSNSSPVSQTSSKSQFCLKQEEELKKILISVFFRAPLKLLLDEENGEKFRRAIEKKRWFQASGLTMKQLTDYWCLLWKEGIEINGEMKKIRSFKYLFEAIGKQKFTSPYDQMGQMSMKELYQKVIFSTFQEFLGRDNEEDEEENEEEGDHFKTWVEKLYKPGKNKHHGQTTSSDEQKRQMFFDCKDYIIARYTNPEKFIKSKK